MFKSECIPARLNAEQTAKYLGFMEHDINTLVQAKLLKPLGKPKPNSVKYFARSCVTELGTDLKWLDRATAAVQAHWVKKTKHSNSGSGELIAAH